MVVLWVLAGLWALAIFANVHARVNKWDFSHYYLSASALRHGENPYTIDLAPMGATLGLQVDEINHATYPPTFLLCFEPLTLMRPAPAYWTWFGLNVLALGLAFFLLLQDDGFDFATGTSLVALAILYPPLLNHFKFAQSQIVILVCLVLMMRSLKSGDNALAGLMLAFASLLRVFPVLMVGYRIVEKKWRALGWAISGLAICGLLTLAFVGVTRSLSFIGMFGLITSRHWYDQSGNLSVSATVSRIFWYTFGNSLSPALDILRRGASAAAELAILSITVRVTVSHSQKGEDLDTRVFALWVVATIMLAPTAWIHYLVLLYIPYALIASAAYARRASLRTIWMAISSFAMFWVYMLMFEAFEPYFVPWVITWSREFVSVSLGMAYVATYWFICDGASKPVRTPLALRGRGSRQTIRARLLDCER
jgi:hypothetical protein